MSETRERLVLLVENNEAQLKLCRDAILSQSPLYGVKGIATGGEAREVMASNHFDLVVMDYEVPDMSGDDLIRDIHQINPNCPIIAMTAADSPDKALKVLMAGASDYLPKIAEYHRFLPRMITTNIQRALLLENLREMYQRVERISRDEALLNRLIVNIHGSLDLEEIIDRAAQSLADEFKVSRAIICLSSDPTSAMRIARQVTIADATPISEKSVLFQRYHDLLLDVGERRPLVVMQEDTFPFATDVKADLVHHGILSMIMVPLVYRGRLMGLVHLDQCYEVRLFTQAEISLLSRIANQLSIAISQARLYQDFETQSNSINKLTDLCTQLNSVVNSTRDLTERQESREKVRVKLSTREIEVLRKVAQGLSNREIAEALHITEGTTEVHVSRLRKKLNLSSRAALVRYAYENHLC
ncbi:MAG TPA: LuxR C-terminal-related transcriptional regulator [Candidatus Melainabacteria bacterium]|nr:LuxR C-terminal-related transcriptional regulator [Candidatus Melainabacteria bacterium]